MPYYDYKCTKCEAIFEIKKGMNDTTEPFCPQCGAKTQRVFNSPRTCHSENRGSCSSCSSGVCSSCKH